MRKIVLTVFPYLLLILVTLFLSIIWWPADGGFVQLTNSWIGLFFVAVFCIIFLLQDEIYHLLDYHSKNNFLLPNEPLQKNRELPAIIKDEQKFQEMISGTVLAWIEKINAEKEEKALQEEDFSQAIEQFKKTKKENIKWLFLFADCYLVQQSKDILYEIYEKHYLTESMFQEIADEITADKEEVKVTLEVLQHLKFIKKQEEDIIITETGSAYCSYLEYAEQK